MNTNPHTLFRSDFEMSILLCSTTLAPKKHISSAPASGSRLTFTYAEGKASIYERIPAQACSRIGMGGLHASTPAAQHDTSTSNPVKLRILLVEDNLINQKVAMRMLQQLGYEADVAVNGREALDATHTQPYDIVLMDVQMPVMDGLEATRRLRAELPPERQPCIIAVTANAMKGDRERCLDSGMDDYVSKPIKLDVLSEAIDRAANRTTLPKAPSDRPSQPGRHSLDAGDSVGPTYRSMNS